MLDLYQATEDERRTVYELYEAAWQPDPWQAFADVLRDWFRNYLELEATAQGVRRFEPLVIPGLLQTEDYARAVLVATGAQQEDIDRQIELRMTRQELLTREEEPVQAWIIIDEAALRRSWGDARTMRAQFARLRELMELPHVLLRVLPFHSGHAAPFGPYSILHLPTGDLVYAETLGGALYHEASAEVRIYRQTFERQWAAGRPAEELISTIMDDL